MSTRTKTSPELAARIVAAKERVRIPDAWRALGLPHPPGDNQKSAHSPFREDKTPSVSIFNGGKGFKDHAYPDHRGDVVSFIQLATGCQRIAAVETLLTWAGDTAPLSQDQPRTTNMPPACRKKLDLAARPPDRPPPPPPSLVGVRPLQPCEITKIAASRGLPESSCTFLARSGHLIGRYTQDGSLSGWALTDAPGWQAPTADGPIIPTAARIIEARNIDRSPFHTGKKTHTIAGSKKDWLIGLSARSWSGYKWRVLLVVEGGPDLLAAHALIQHLGLENILPIAVMGRGNKRIHAEAAQLIAGCRCHIIPDFESDKPEMRAGITAAESFARDLFFASGATKVTYSTLHGLTNPDGHQAEDLCEAIEHDGINRNGDKLNQLLPHDIR